MKYVKLYEDFLLLDRIKQKNILTTYPGIKENKKLPPLLVIPGGGGNPINDYANLAPLLSEKYDLITFYYNENKQADGKKITTNIANQLKEKLGERLSHLSILGFSMGTRYGFWIIHSLGKDFKGKFICIDSGAPHITGTYINSTLKNNTPRRYQCTILPFYESDIKGKGYPLEKGQEPSDKQMNSFRYSYSDEIQKQIKASGPRVSPEGKLPDLQNCTEKDFKFKGQKLYEKWRNDKSLVIEFVDNPNQSGQGEHYPSELSPSGIWVKGKPYQQISDLKKGITIMSSSEPVFPMIDFVKNIMKETGVKDDSQVWIVEDKQDLKRGGFYFVDQKKGDFYFMIDFLKKQDSGIVGSFGRNSKNPETLESVPSLIIRAGKLCDKELSIEEAQRDIDSIPSNNTKFEIIKGVEHFNICQVAANEIAELTFNFLK